MLDALGKRLYNEIAIVMSSFYQRKQEAVYDEL